MLYNVWNENQRAEVWFYSGKASHDITFISMLMANFVCNCNMISIYCLDMWPLM